MVTISCRMKGGSEVSKWDGIGTCRVGPASLSERRPTIVKFEQRIECQQPLGEGDSAIEPIGIYIVVDQLGEGPYCELVKPTPLGRYPLQVAPS